MIDIKFKHCCDSCRFISPYMNHNPAYSDNEFVWSTLTIGCDHETVCSKFLSNDEEKVEENSMPAAILRKGQAFKVVLYNGPSEIEARTLSDWLEDFERRQAPAPLNGSDFNILVKEVKLFKFPDMTSRGGCIYSVELGGEFV